MTEKQEEYAIQVKSTAVLDGAIQLRVEKLGAWVNAQRDYQKLNVGTTMVPHGTILVNVPIAGMVAGQEVPPPVIAEMLTHLLEMSLPACRVFVGQVEDDFGYKPPGDWGG